MNFNCLEADRKSTKKSIKIEDESEGNIKSSNNTNLNNLNVNSLSTRVYLEQTVVAVVMQGMAELAKERPENPLEYLGNYILSQARK